MTMRRSGWPGRVTMATAITNDRVRFVVRPANCMRSSTTYTKLQAADRDCWPLYAGRPAEAKRRVSVARGGGSRDACDVLAGGRASSSCSVSGRLVPRLIRRAGDSYHSDGEVASAGVPGAMRAGDRRTERRRQHVKFTVSVKRLSTTSLSRPN